MFTYEITSPPIL